MELLPFAIAVKAFIVDTDKLLLVKRRPNDPHKPNTWDIPGGRLAPGENPYDGLRREAKEEAAIEIEPVCPIGVQHFTRDDGQKITMLLFYCRPSTTNIQLSQEHTEYRWVNLLVDDDITPTWLKQEINLWRKIEKK